MSSWTPSEGERRPEAGGYPPSNFPAQDGYPPPNYGRTPYDSLPQWAPGHDSNDPYSTPPQHTGPNGLAIAALVLGVIGIFLLNVFLGPLAVIFGVLGLNRAKRGASGRGMAIAGIALGVFDVAIWVALVLLVRASLGAL